MGGGSKNWSPDDEYNASLQQGGVKKAQESADRDAFMSYSRLKHEVHRALPSSSIYADLDLSALDPPPTYSNSYGYEGTGGATPATSAGGVGGASGLKHANPAPSMLGVQSSSKKSSGSKEAPPISITAGRLYHGSAFELELAAKRAAQQQQQGSAPGSGPKMVFSANDGGGGGVNAAPLVAVNTSLEAGAGGNGNANNNNNYNNVFDYDSYIKPKLPPHLAKMQAQAAAAAKTNLSGSR